MSKSEFLYAFSILLLLALFLQACGMKQAPQGIAVDTLRPVQSDFTAKCDQISVVYIASERVTAAEGVHLSSQEENMIVQQVKKICNQIGYISTTGVPPDLADAGYHDLNIKVLYLDIQKEEQRDSYVKKAKVGLSVTFNQGGFKQCGSEKLVQEIIRQAPEYKSSELPSNFKLKTSAVNKTLKHILHNFIPGKSVTFRPVFEGGQELTRTAAMLNSQNCQEAWNILQPKVKQDTSNYKLLYQAGVALECIASQRNRQKAKVQALNKAYKYYMDALSLAPENTKVQRAVNEVSQTKDLYTEALNRQQGVEQGQESFDTPDSF